MLPFLIAPMVKLVDTADLKSAAFVNNGRAGSIPARGTKPSDPTAFPLAIKVSHPFMIR